FIANGSPSKGYKVAPTVATTTVCPASTFGAPQTISSGLSRPTSTLVTFNLSALGCCSQLNTLPITTPFNPPGTLCTCSSPSTSNPISVKISESSCGVSSILSNLLSQLYEIFMLKIYKLPQR